MSDKRDDKGTKPETPSAKVQAPVLALRGGKSRIVTDPRQYAGSFDLSSIFGLLAQYGRAVDADDRDEAQRVAQHIDAAMRGAVSQAYADGWAACDRHAREPNETPDEQAAREAAEAELAERNRKNAEEHTRFAMQNPHLGISGLRTH